MTDYVPWLRKLAKDGGKGTVNNIDARCLGRIADEIERLRELFRIDGEQHAAHVKNVQHEQDARIVAYKAEIERLRNLAADLMSLLEEMPIKHPQQAEHRERLRKQFPIQQTTRDD
jgi:hypothetical protein